MESKKQLIEYREILENISRFKLTNEQLAKMAKGEIPYPAGFPTGYPSLDKLWLKYFETEFLAQSLPKETLFDYMYNKSKAYRNYTAITYYGREITYDEFYENIDMAAKFLKSLGVSANDRIMYLVPNIPEASYLFYGTSKIGATSDYVDPRPDSVDTKVSSKKILDLFISEKCKYIVALDLCYISMIKPIEKELKELGVENIVLLSAQDSMTLKSTLNYAAQNIRMDGFKEFSEKMKTNKKVSERIESAIETSTIPIIKYKEALEQVRYTTYQSEPYDANRLEVITHTSGTSGKPKPVPLTTLNLNSAVHQTFGARMPFQPGDRVLHILPFFAAYGVADNVHATFAHATNSIEVPEIKTNNFGKLLAMSKANVSIGMPTWYLSILNDPSIRNKSMKNLKWMSSGGMSMEISDEIQINEYIKAHGGNIVLSKGHGMSEITGCGSVATGEFNALGSLGIPFPNTTYALIDPETGELLRFEEGIDELKGEFIISSPSVSSGILDGNKYSEQREYFGENYLLTGDYGTMRRDGQMFFDSRLDRAFPRYDGYNIKPSKIENAIKSDKRVRYCVATSYYDEKQLGDMLKVYIVLESGVSETKENIVKDIITNCFIANPAMASREIPAKIIFIDELPYTKNGKIDYAYLRNLDFDGSEISIIIDETNISIDKIDIVSNKVISKVYRK